MASNQASEADYVIVGGGLTGCALASRLHQIDPSLDICVLEAGPDASDNSQTRDPVGAFALAGTELDYNYQTRPQSNTSDRVHSMTSGKVLGGGSILNYGAWARGDAADYDQWGRTVGDPSWSYNGLLPYLKKAEDHLGAAANPEERGSNGPMRVCSVLAGDPDRKYGLREPIRAAWAELGLQVNPRGDCGSLKGICERHENWKDGVRQPSNLAYSLQGVTVTTNSPVHKVLFDDKSEGAPVASAVLLVDGRELRARKEIVLCAGTVSTPKILMLSGIGAANTLSKHSIPLVCEIPDVGRNFFDHFAHFQVWKLRNPEKGLSMGSPLWNNPALDKGLPCDWAVNEGLPPQLSGPALQLDGVNGKESDESIGDPARCHIETMAIYSPAGAPVPMDGSYIATSTMLLLPTSRGSVSIVSASPSDAPAIDANYYDTELDRAALIHGTRRLAEAFLETAAGKTYIEGEGAPPGMAPLTARSSDSDIDARIRRTAWSHYHSSGTAAMGKVIDTDLTVKGVKGLRVADASIYPVAIGGHPQATLYGIAEKAAEVILEST